MFDVSEIAHAFLASAWHKTPAGCKRLEKRCVFTGTIFILQTSLPREWLFKEMGCGSAVIPCRWAHDWKRAGTRQIALHLSGKLRPAGQFDFSRMIANSSSICAMHGKAGLNPTDRHKADGKPHLVVEAMVRRLMLPD